MLIFMIVMRFGGEICLHHNLCIEVERDMRLLRRQSQPQTEEEVEKKMEEEEEGSIEEEDEWSTIYEKEWSTIDEKEWWIDEEEDCTLELASLDTSSSFRHGFVEKWTVKMDEPYIISNLFSNSKYLVNRRGKKVSIDRLNGKYLLLYFWWLPRLHERGLFNPYLKELYKLNREYFEIVFVALGSNKNVFCETFSWMPWLAIPHKDQQARDFFIGLFAIPNPTFERAVLFAPNGTVVRDNAGPPILSYGAHGFPFTRERIDILISECDSLRYKIFVIKQMPSLSELLGEHLIYGEKEKVPTSELGLKIVGLYFFEPTPKGIQRTHKLLKTWNSLTAQQRDDFKPVIINKAPFNLRNAMAVFRKKFEHTVPCWYSLEVCGLKLCRFFRKEHRSETDEAEYGSDAYLFTLERAVKLTKMRQQNELVLDEFLSPETLLCRGGCAHCKVDIVDSTVKKLWGKRVLLFFATHSCCEFGSFLPDLKRMYEKKGTYDNFEIIYISLDCKESPSSFCRSTQGMPWLVHPFVPHFTVVLA